jgi:hypothetical protein
MLQSAQQPRVSANAKILYNLKLIFKNELAFRLLKGLGYQSYITFQRISPLNPLVAILQQPN